MKHYADLFAESPRAFLRKLEEDIKSIEARLARLDHLTGTAVGNLLSEYERLSLLVEQKAYGVVLGRSWRWDPIEGPKVANMYAAESLADGRAYCWTGPGAVTTFAIPVLRDEALDLRIAFMKTFEPDMLAALAVLVDGEPVRHQIGTLEILASIVPRAQATASPTVISITTKSTASPGADDSRLLGIAIYGIEVKAAAASEDQNA